MQINLLFVDEDLEEINQIKENDYVKEYWVQFN
jgi:hypothetical protein